MKKNTLAILGVVTLTVFIMSATTAYFVVASSGPNSSATIPSGNPMTLVILPGGTTFKVSSSFDCVAGHHALSFSIHDRATLAGAFIAGRPGVTGYIATARQAGTIHQGHPSQWVYSTGLVKSSRFSVHLVPGSYVFWFEGADMNCGSSIVMPLELLTQVNITRAFTLTPA